MDKQAFFNHLEELLEVEPGKLTGHETLQGLPEWDSLAVVSFLAMADEKYGKSIEPEKLQEMRTIADLVNLLSE